MNPHNTNEDNLDLNKFMQVMNCFNIGTWTWNIQTGETIFDDRWAAIIGYTLDELTPTTIKTWVDATHPDDLKQSEEALQRHFSGDTEYYEIQARMKHKDGHWVWVLDRGKVIERSLDGKPLIMSGAHLELSLLKQQESLKLNTQFQTIIENAPFPIVISNKADSTLRYVNKRAQDRFNLFLDTAQYRHVFDFYVHPQQRTTLLDQLNRNGSLYDYEIELYDGNRKPFWALLSLAWVEYENEPSLLIAVNDITQQKLNEQELTRRAETYRLLTDTMADVIWVYNISHNRFDYVSPTVMTLRGFTQEEALKQRFEDTMPESYVRHLNLEYEKAIPEYLKDPDHPKNYLHEIRQFRKDGSLVWVEISSKIRRNQRGEIEIISSTRNIEARKTMEANLDYLNLHDPLTDLLNKAAFRYLMEQEKNKPTRYQALIHIDLDSFGSINDRLGHLKGDEILREQAKLMAQLSEQIGTVYHYDSDEFLILIDKTEEPIEAFVRKISKTITQQLLIDGQIFLLTASIGYALSDGKKTLDVLFSESTTAMFLAKRRHNAVVAYHDDMSDAKIRESRLENDLRFAIERSELELYYQPIFSVKHATVSEAEALLRWNHPELGLISPIEFIPIAEKTRLIVPMTDWVIHQACQFLANWDEKEKGPFSVSINISFITLTNRGDDLFNHLKQEIRMAGIEASRLKLEVTESSLVQDATEVIRVFIQLRELGLRLVLDDFGTGYSSFAYLKALPLDIVKIDRSLVTDLELNPKSQLIVQSMITVLHGLNLRVVIEGVENTRQFTILKNMGSDYIQGYLLAKPLRVPHLMAYLAKHQFKTSLPVDYNAIDVVQLVLHWKPEWDCGNPVIDHQHHDLMNRAAELEQMTNHVGHNPDLFIQKIDEILGLVEDHFKDEESILLEHAYSSLDAHRLEHERLIEQSRILRKAQQAGQVDTFAFVAFIIREVLFEHILKDDLLYFPFVTPLKAAEPINYIADVSPLKTEVMMKPYRVILSENMAFQSLIAEISTSFINLDLDQFDAKLNATLALCGKQVNADRVYVFRYDWSNSVCDNTYEWCAEGITPQIAELQGVPLDMIPDWVNAHLVGETINIPDVKELPVDSAIRQILEPQQIQSLLTVPMIADNVCYGFVGFDSVRTKHLYSEYERVMLKEVSNLLLSALKRKAVEEQLVFEKELYATTVSSLGEALIILDEHLTIVSANPMAETLLNAGISSLRGQDIQDVFPLTDIMNGSKINLDWETLTKTNEIIFPIHCGFMNASGLPVFIAGSIRTLIDRKGRPEAALIHFSDITSEYEIQKQIDAFLNVNLDMVVVADVDGYFHKVNQRLADALGYAMEELNGRRFLDLVHPDDVAKTIDIISDPAKNKVIRNFTNRYRTQSGTYRHLEWQAQLGYGNYLYASARDVTERVMKEETSTYLSYHDPLTGLYNRRYVEDRMQQIAKVSDLHPISVLMIDIDSLKKVNDTLGHLVGDDTIVSVAKRLTGRCRPEDIIGRWGGDEFILILPNTDIDQAMTVAKRLNEPDPSGISISVGVATKLLVADEFSDVLRNADQRMYTIKRSRTAKHESR